MAQSIAILIGNTNYSQLTSLACCKKDVNRMHELLSATQKFSQIISIIDKSVSSAKDMIRELAELDDSVEEIFFYFSGHGLSNTEDFYMCFDEFKVASPNSTGLSRTDAFDMIRLFNADLSVVVIDACEAGRNLIKSDSSPLARNLKSGFSNFLQFSSCTESQSSLAGERISVFTDEFIKACLQKESGALYYTDVENALRDAFLDNSTQIPHFIRQGTSQEKFCQDSSRLNDFRNSYLATSNSDSPEEERAQPATTFSLAKEAINKIEACVPSEKDAQEFIDSVFHEFANTSDLMAQLTDYFDTRTIKHDDFDYVRNKRAVIDLLKSRGGSDSFVSGEIEKTKRHKPFSAFGSAFAQFSMPDEYDETYNLLNNCGLNSVHVGIYFEPKYMALNRVFSEIVFLPRLTECLILTSDSVEQRSAWGSFSKQEQAKKWKWSHHSWNENPAEITESYITDPYGTAKKYILSFGENSSS